MTEETVRPEDLKPGDRVRVTLEGVCEETAGGFFDFKFDGSCEPTPLESGELAHATITRLPPPVDPDLELARKVVAERGSASEKYIAGLFDDSTLVQVALAAIKAAKEQG